jgi:NADH:ubiquinone oxidoreductase subunit
MGFFSEIFAWWTGSTWGTRFTIWKQGRFVGSDDLGNRYYAGRSNDGPLGRQRRWVLYRDLADASKVPPEWHGWLHHTVDTLPTDETYTPRPWQKPHRPNPTGTAAAERPAGSILANGQRQPTGGDYQPWRPE